MYLSWALLFFVVVGPVIVAASSPLQNSREIIYVVGGLAGVVALSLLLVQPLLAIGYLKGVNPIKQRRWHKASGTLLIMSVGLHIGALYMTSPDDMTDALLLRSATPFSVYGVIALWAVVLIGVLVAFRRRLKISVDRWRSVHVVITAIVVITSIVHALWVLGTMGTVSKWVLCVTILIATGYAVLQTNTVQTLFKK